MGIPRFFCVTLDSPVVLLDERESRHAQGARRLAPGDEVALFDGEGTEACGKISLVHKKGVEVAISTRRPIPRPTPHLTLAVALPKGPRQDVLVEKCTELGVGAIQPLITHRSISGASSHRLEKWRHTCIEAAKQSGQAWLPRLNEPISLPDLLQSLDAFEAVYIASAGAELNAAGVSWPERVLVLIGPEGDWSPHELNQAQQAGARTLSLGPNALRVETAAIVVAALVRL